MSIAATNLAALMSMGGQITQAEDAATALDRLEPDPGDAPADGEASFGTAEAIATAVVGTALLGPVGGLLLGGAQGWLKKRGEQDILDRMAAEQTVLTDAVGVYDDVLQGFKDSARTPEDLAQIATLKAQQISALKRMNSADPATRQDGAAAFAEFEAGTQVFARNQETDIINKTADDARLAFELDGRQHTRFTQLQADFTAESAQFEGVMSAVDQAQRALDGGTPAQLFAASIMIRKALDPTSAVLTEEASAVGEVGSLWSKAETLAQGWANGESIIQTNRQDFVDMLSMVRDSVTTFQTAREARFLNKALDAELPEKYLDDFNLTGTLPEPPTVKIAGNSKLEQERIKLIASKDDATTIFLDTIDDSKAFIQSMFPGKDAARKANNDLLRKQRQEMGADPETGIFPIRRTN